MHGKLSEEFQEFRGCKQGNLKSGDHYKIYVAPSLEMLDSADLGVWIGPINTAVSCYADDVLAMSDDQDKLQGLLDMAQFYGNMYQVEYGASKTKITISGPEVDRTYYKEVSPWSMDGEKVKVVDDNDHLGQVISGERQVGKNIDLRIKKSRNTLFGLLGPAYQYKSLMSPSVKIHLFITYACPILRSGLSTFVLRKPQIEPLEIFQRKCLKAFLHLSQTAPTPAIHFLLRELPIEGKLHRDIFSLFYSVWTNPDINFFGILKYLLENSCENSRTWAIYLRQISQMYGLEDPLDCLNRDPPSKSQYKELILTTITAFHEQELRNAAVQKEKMPYLNVSITGLKGKLHPAVTNVFTTHAVKKMRPHIKMLSGNYLTFEEKSLQSGGSPFCRLCIDVSEPESLKHLISKCEGTLEIRSRIITKMNNLCHDAGLNIDLKSFSNELLVQFVLDPSSLNLKNRVSINHPVLPSLFQISRDFCYSIDRKRIKVIQQSKTP